MQDQNSSVCAAIDIGSNTVHIVVARCLPASLDILEDQQEMVRIGESVTATGAISPQKRDAAVSVLHKYKALAEQHSAQRIFVAATEAIRQATNRDDFLADVRRETGLEVHLIEGDVEASLTFHGGTYVFHDEPHPPTHIGVMDLGGGSTELVAARDMQITWRTSVPVGSGWLHDRYFHSDPPSYDDLEVARTFLRTYFQNMHIKYCPPALIVTGGSANSLFQLAREAFGVHELHRALTLHDVISCLGLLRTLPPNEIASRYHVHTARAPILPAGALIILAAMERLRLDEIRVSPYGIREGMLLAYSHYGDQWLEQVTRQSTHIQQGNMISDQLANEVDVQDETFGESGQRMLQERAEKMVSWRDEVLKHEDVEAVHKMRVASRRLRAVLDAYESICEPGRFKKVYRRVKKLADILGQARDTDVMIQNLQAQLAEVSNEEQTGMQWLIERLSAYRQAHQERLEAALKQLDKDKFPRQVVSCLPKGGRQHGKG
ncbi:MAG TPA: CHAD domain-containing protein [Ktedonobacteraceae bacterium]|nr:CHAD domain-containing protein [Ktedonobacteraceae bacterium]